jgi:hypothetical protein
MKGNFDMNFNEESNKNIKEAPFNITNNILIENDNRKDFESGFTYKPIYDNSVPYLMNVKGRDECKRLHEITSASWETDKAIFEKYNCNYNPIKTDYNEYSDGQIYTWQRFFKYLNIEIKHRINEGFYSYVLDIPKEWVEENNILIMITRIIYYKQYTCKIYSNFNKETNSFNYKMLIRWDNLPDKIFEENIENIKIENQIPRSDPGMFTWTETTYNVPEKHESLIERIFNVFKI